MPFNPNDSRLPINPGHEQLKGMFGGMTEVSGTAPVPYRYRNELQNMRDDRDGVRDPLPDAEAHFPLDQFPGRISRAATSIAGLARVLVPGGYRDRAWDRAERLEHRLDVATFIGLRIMQPRSTGSQKEKVSWKGIHKMTDPTVPGRHAQPNYYRPTTKSELSVASRLESVKDKARTGHNNADWLDTSYATVLPDKAWGRELLATGAAKSRRERHHMHGISSDIGGSVSEGNDNDRKYERIANARDLRGTIIRARLRRANRISRRPNARSEPLVEIDVPELRRTSRPRVWH